MNLLLVTGSRALANTPAAEWWATQRILTALSRLDLGAELVTGDARGPDEWARRLAIHLRVPTLVFNLWGKVEDSGEGWRWTQQQRPPFAAPEGKRWPLVRNAAMVDYVRGRAAGGARVHVLALAAPWADTRGTGHTAGLARGAGLVVETHECPRALGPVEEVRDAG